MTYRVSIACLLSLLPFCCMAEEIYGQVPEVIHADQRYVIYSHGLIVEGDNERPVSPEFGVYDFPGIKAALFEGGGFNLIAHHRPKNTQFDAYVLTLEAMVKRLLEARVKPSRITLIGFSRGGGLTAHAAARLKDTGINTAILAACFDSGSSSITSLDLGGNLLSIYETTDLPGSCSRLAAHSHLTSFQEVAITTGRKHGAFFQPLKEWLGPLKKWIGETNR
jgi:pimeloyl-ACP methyl ester carboxylesterase